MLAKIFQKHKIWIDIVSSFGCNKDTAEDIVQEMYIRLDKYSAAEKVIKKDGTVNRAYIHFTLRNIFKDLMNERSKHRKVDLDEAKHLGVEYDYIPRSKGQMILEAKINEETRNWHWFDVKLFKIYRNEGKSMRELSKKKPQTKLIVPSL